MWGEFVSVFIGFFNIFRESLITGCISLRFVAILYLRVKNQFEFLKMKAD